MIYKAVEKVRCFNLLENGQNLLAFSFFKNHHFCLVHHLGWTDKLLHTQVKSQSLVCASPLNEMPCSFLSIIQMVWLKRFAKDLLKQAGDVH